MSNVVDRKGNEIKIGDIVRVKGSDILRRVQAGTASAKNGTAPHLSDDGLIHSISITGKYSGDVKWIVASKCELVEVAA